MRRVDSWKRLWCWEGLGAGGGGDDRGWNGWMASPTWWTWVWVNSRSWWWTGSPGELRFMGSQRVGHDWVTELNWNTFKVGVTVVLTLCIKKQRQREMIGYITFLGHNTNTDSNGGNDTPASVFAQSQYTVLRCSASDSWVHFCNSLCTWVSALFNFHSHILSLCFLLHELCNLCAHGAWLPLLFYLPWLYLRTCDPCDQR